MGRKNNMKAVFISQAVLNKNNGGGQFVRSLTGLLRKAVGVDNVTVISLPDQNDTAQHSRVEKNLIIYEDSPNKIQMAKNVLSGCPKWVSRDIFDKIVTYIKSEKFDFVFLGFSTYEYLIKKIKKETDLPVFVMYQGVTPNTKKSRLVDASLFQKIKAFPSYEMVLKRERTNAMLADCNIVHNKRERNAFFHYYKKEPEMYLPVFIADKFSDEKGQNPGYNDFSLLFIGSNFGPNLSGLKWFVENVMPNLPNGISLYVVGQGMKVLEREVLYQKTNIHIIGEVEELDPWYYHADLIVEPIFEGDGMKTKTVEAMMFGKTILGSDEAFCGYEGLNNYLCNTADDFVKRIIDYKQKGVEKFNNAIRTIYLKKYSEDAVLDTMRKAISKYVDD